jgi:hypothetical protein
LEAKVWWLTWSHRYDLWGKVAAIVFVVLSTRFTLAWMDVAPAGATEDPRFMTAWFVMVGVAFTGWWFLFSPMATWLYTSRVLGLNVSWAQARLLDGLFSADRDGRWHTAGDLLMVRPEQRLEPLLARAEAARRDREGDSADHMKRAHQRVGPSGRQEFGRGREDRAIRAPL